MSDLALSSQENIVRYRYAWGNNPVRALLKGRKCRLLASGSMNAVAIEFEGGTRIVTSRRALRKDQPDD